MSDATVIAPTPASARDAPPPALRLAVYCDFPYRRVDGRVHASDAFALFLDELARRVRGLTLVGRVDPRAGSAPYRLEHAAFAELPFYEALTSPARSLRTMAASLRRFSRVLDDVDAVWLLGPHPLAIAFALLARARGRRVVLGVRQSMDAYMRSRHPGRRWLWAAGAVLERAWRLLARRLPVVVVGPELAEQYRSARELLPATISLIRAAEIDDGPRPEPSDEVRLLSVGRLDAEKNPLLLADILAALNDSDRRWRLTVCGTGALEDALADRLRALGVDDRAELLGYVPFDGGLADRYRESDLLLHVSWTEGLPQVLFEAFAAGLPVVATDVGGVRAAAGGASELIGAGDADAAVAALRRLVDDPERREALVEAGRQLVRTHTVEAETGRIARFIAG